ncbi:hypothetical protein DFA_05051 [Cavenderia fasciculata]|uniref:MRH domain-containing protein n=1 Tax=Cavenderia fasciculata TaxID=261658 RepID=F4PN68_CACFS|nr:uncharacterized protein DFA_05051 [Cavenderia fasciculata]EGG22921.1 hypothetical protein DFA_05051 [Cavenderia fasciculata]|eukprot:XP_004360772.1 hypothetical protein DFA_05051 [Cavenderia fasciculata]
MSTTTLSPFIQAIIVQEYIKSIQSSKRFLDKRSRDKATRNTELKEREKRKRCSADKRKRPISGPKLWYLLERGKPYPKLRPYIDHRELINLALVCRWWLQVVRQTRTKINILGFLEDGLFRAFSSSYSVYDSSLVETLNWKVLDDHEQVLGIYHDNFNYKQLVQLLPQLKTLNLVCKGVYSCIFKGVHQIVNDYPHITVNFELQLDEMGPFDWPIDAKIRSNTCVVKVGKYSYIYDLFGDNDGLATDAFLDFLEDIKPQYLNMHFGEKHAHISYPEIFKRIKDTWHLNIGSDFVEPAKFKQLLAHPYKLESLRLEIPVCCFGDELCDIHDSSDTIIQEKDWNEFCHNLSNNTTLKRLNLVNQCLDHDTNYIESFNRLDTIWNDNPHENESKIEFLELERFASYISSQMFDVLCHNQYITTLMLTEGTLTESFLPSFSNMVSINTTIKTLSISGNLLKSTQDLSVALKTNKSITVLDITQNEFENSAAELYDALLVNDKIEYLVVCQANDAQASNLPNCQFQGIDFSGFSKSEINGTAVVTYSSGTPPCKSSGRVRQINMYLQCEEAGPPMVISADEPTPCLYEVFLSGPSTCPVGSSSSGSSKNDSYDSLVILSVTSDNTPITL